MFKCFSYKLKEKWSFSILETALEAFHYEQNLATTSWSIFLLLIKSHTIIKEHKPKQ